MKKEVVYINNCVRCGKPIKNQEIGHSAINCEPAHVKCAEEWLDEFKISNIYENFSQEE